MIEVNFERKAFKMTLFGQKIPPELLIAAPVYDNFFMNQGMFANGLVLFAIIASMKKPWEYDN